MAFLVVCLVLLQKGFTPLHEAARSGHVQIVILLIKHYENPDPEGKVCDDLFVKL